MDSSVEFQQYLDAIAIHYSKNASFYTPTDALLPLKVQSIHRQKQEGKIRQVEKLPVLKGLRKYALGEKREHVLLAGRPGSGKSTVLRQLVVALAADGLVPVLVQLKGNRTVPQLIKAEFRARAKERITDEQIEDWLLADRLVLLLDGVNEVPTDELRRELALFREENSTVAMIFTTRDVSLGGDLGIGKRLEMQPLSEPQLQKFVGNYLGEKGDRLLGQLRDRLREIAETPLLLKMLCDVFESRGELPQSKGELFQWFDWDYERIKKGVEYVPVSENFWLFKAQILQHLAFATIQADLDKPTEAWYSFPHDRAVEILEDWLRSRGMTDAPTKAALWVKDLINYHLLQDAAEPGKVEFHHQLFQEYYAAKELLEMFNNRHSDVMDSEKFQHYYLNYLKWTESVAIGLSLMANEKQVVKIVKQALNVDFMLGARLTGEVHPDFLKKIIEVLSHFNFSKKLYIQFLGETGSNQTLVILEELLKRKDLFHHVIEALRVLGTEKSIQVLVNIISTNLTYSESIYTYVIEALGEIPNSNIIQHLQAISVEHPLFHVRQFAKKELIRIQKNSNRNIIDIDSSPQKITIKQSISTEAIDTLKRDLSCLNIEMPMAESDELLDFMGLLIDHASTKLRIQSVKALAEIKHHRAVSLLDRALKNSHFDVRAHAATRLAKIDDPLVVPSLISAFKKEQKSSDHSVYVCSMIIRALGTTKDSEALAFIESLIEHDDTANTTVLIAAIEQFCIPKSIDFLYDHLSSEKGQNEVAAIMKSIATIQENCKFYSYKIFKNQRAQSQLSQQSSIDASASLRGNRLPLSTQTSITISKMQQSNNQPIFHIGSVGNLNTSDVTIQGNQVGIQSNYTTNPEIQSTITQLQEFLNILQTQNPNITNETEALAIIDAEFTEIQTTPNHRLKNLRQQLLNPERHAQAFKATIVEVAKQQLETNPFAIAAITYFDKLSETPDQGA